MMPVCEKCREDLNREQRRAAELERRAIDAETEAARAKDSEAEAIKARDAAVRQLAEDGKANGATIAKLERALDTEKDRRASDADRAAKAAEKAGETIKDLRAKLDAVKKALG